MARLAGKIRSVQLLELSSSPYRYSKPQPDQESKLRYAIQQRGQIVPVVLRRKKATSVAAYEIVDGHRIADALRSLGEEKCTAIDLGEVPDLDAMVLMLELNEHRGMIDHVALAILIRDLLGQVSADFLASRINFTAEQVDSYKELVTFDLEAFERGDTKLQSEMLLENGA